MLKIAKQLQFYIGVLVFGVLCALVAPTAVKYQREHKETKPVETDSVTRDIDSLINLVEQ